MDRRNGPPKYRAAEKLAEIAKKSGFDVKMYVDDTDGYDDNAGDLTLERFKEMANNGLVLFKGHGFQGGNYPVLFSKDVAGRNSALKWYAGEVGMICKACKTKYASFWGVRCSASWYAANWNPFLVQGDAAIFWQSCHSGEASVISQSTEESAGGRLRIAWKANPGENITVPGTINDGDARSTVKIIFGTMSENSSARSAALAIDAKYNELWGTCKISGNEWTTLCPGPVSGNAYFPRAALKKGEVSLGCMILDTTIDSEWSPDRLVTLHFPENFDEASANQMKVEWLRQEGLDSPYGIRFRVLKKTNLAIGVTARHTMIRNTGKTYPGDIFVHTDEYADFDESNWMDNAPGRALDSDGVAPNTGDISWSF